MSDIYENEYISAYMRQRVQIVDCYMDPEDMITLPEETVNTDDFSGRDLQQFVDSLETIARLEKAKHAKRLSLKIKRHEESFEKSKNIVTCLDSLEVITAEDQDDSRSNFTAENSDNIYDETYYNLSYQSSSYQTSMALYSNLITTTTATGTLQTLKSESEESGVFCNNTTLNSEEHIYEDIDAVYPIRPRAQVITEPKTKSLKSRLISKIMKKQYVIPQAPVTDLLSSTTIGEDLEEDSIYDRIVDDAIHQQYIKNSSAKKNKYRLRYWKKSMKSDAESKFLEKALRHLTL